MRIIPIADVFGMDHDDTVDAVCGTVKDLFPHKAGNNSNGSWSLQNLTLVDQTGEIKIQVKDRDALPSNMKGRAIIIHCNQGQKGKTGLKAKDDNYKGVSSRIVSVTPTAHIIEYSDEAVMALANGGTPPAAAPAPAPRQTAPAPAPFGTPPPRQNTPAPAPAPRPAPAVNGNGNGHHAPNVKVELNKLANLYLHCMAAADYIEGQRETDLPDEHYQAMVHSLFIQATRDHLHNHVPAGTFAKQNN